MLTPEQIDAALGALQQQIDDLRADGEPVPEPTPVFLGSFKSWQAAWEALRMAQPDPADPQSVAASATRRSLNTCAKIRYALGRHSTHCHGHPTQPTTTRR